MALTGSLDTMSLPDLLQWLGGARKTGVVALSQGAITKRIYLENGMVTGSSSNDPSDFLGQFLLSYGRITEDQLRDALESQQGSSEYLGTYLIQMGAITQPELTRMLGLKTEETVYSLFNWERAQFEYEDCAPESSPFPVALRIDDILLKGARRFDEMAQIRKEIPSGVTVPRRTSQPLPPEILQSSNLRRLAEAVDGVRSVASIALHTHTSEFLASKFLYEGIRAGFIEIPVPSAPVRLDANSGLIQAVQVLFEAGDYEAVLTLLEHRRLDDDDSLQILINQAEMKFVETVTRSSMLPEKIPTLLRSTPEILEERLSPEEYFLISRINGSWDIRSIISVSPLREVDALYVLRRLEKRGFLTMKDPVPAKVGG